MVKRVDVLTGGASTVYGSDAVAGVVNFILDTDFNGVRGGLQYSFYNHDNNNALAQEINRAAGFDPPTGITNDGDALNANIALGGSFADGKGHASAYIEYRKIDELRRGDRDYLPLLCVSSMPMASTAVDRRHERARRVFSLNSDGSPNRTGIHPRLAGGRRRRPLVPAVGRRALQLGCVRTTSNARTKSGTPAPSPTTRSTGTSTSISK